MSDINLQFGWFAIAVLTLMLGWPGAIVGVAAGALAWRRRRILGGLLGALAGAALWGGLYFAVWL